MQYTVDPDFPDWAKKGLELPLKSGDILFRSVSFGEGDWEANALVRKADEYAYTEGYRLAGRIIADYVIQSRWEADFLIYPVIFLYRHNVELQLKGLIEKGTALVEQELSAADRALLGKSHSLDELWKRFKPVLQKAGQGIVAITPEEIEGLDWYVSELHNFDPKSFSGRYALKRDGSPYIDSGQYPAINIGALAESMERLTSTLFGLARIVEEALDLKHEMEADVRDDYTQYEYMDFNDGE